MHLSVGSERVKGWGGVGHPQDAVHLAAARSGCKGSMVGTGWADSCAGCMNRLRKRYSHLWGVHFWRGKAAWALNGFLLTENVHACQ